MQRRDDWDVRLAEYLQSCRTRGFAWGSFDCCLFVCDAILAMTGTDPAAPLRGKYSTALGAFAALKKQSTVDSQQLTVETGLPHAEPKTFLQSIALIAEKCGCREISPMFAQRGDVAAITAAGEWQPADGGLSAALGLIGFDGRIVALHPERGLVELPLTAASTAWRI